MLSLSDVAIDFFDGRLCFFEFGRSHGEVRPKVCGTLPFPALQRDMRQDAPVFSQAAAALKAFAKDKGYRMVRAIIHEGDVYAFKMRVPTINPKELRPAIEAGLEENVPIPPAEALFEYEVISTDSVRNETVVAVTAISNKVVASYISLLAAADMTPILFETESRAMARALVPRGDMGNHAVLAIEERHTVLFIVERGVATFSSFIELGSLDLVHAVAKTFSVTETEARALMAGVGSKPGVDEKMVFESMLPIFSTMSDELGRLLLYFKGESQKERGATDIDSIREISDIILAGTDVRIPGFAQYVSASLRVTARVGSVWTNVALPEGGVPELDERVSLGYAALIGAHFS